MDKSQQKYPMRSANISDIRSIRHKDRKSYYLEMWIRSKILLNIGQSIFEKGLNKY